MEGLSNILKLIGGNISIRIRLFKIPDFFYFDVETFPLTMKGEYYYEKSI